jgi:hypothetical protein
MIDYKLVYELDTQAVSDTVFNLGFGNYDPATDKIIDEDNSNNGDHYHVFNTVLSTIPHFFGLCPQAFLVVMGSDNKPDFPETCRPGCTKKCLPGKCKNFQRRIRAYQGYVEKNWVLLNNEYDFKGGLLNAAEQVEVQDYQLGHPYDAV